MQLIGLKCSESVTTPDRGSNLGQNNAMFAADSFIMILFS